MPDGGTKLPGALAIASEGALTLIGASLNRLVFPAILRSCRRPMQEVSAYVATPSLVQRYSGYGFGAGAAPREAGQLPRLIRVRFARRY
jgi:hypothetical protein